MIKYIDIKTATITDDANDDPVVTEKYIYRRIKAEINPISQSISNQLKILQSGNVMTDYKNVIPCNNLTNTIKEGYELTIYGDDHASGTDYTIIDFQDHDQVQTITIKNHAKS